MPSILDDEEDNSPSIIFAKSTPSLSGNEYEQMLKKQLQEAPAPAEGPDALQLAAALSQSANQMGTIGGRTADSSQLKNFADTMSKYKENQQKNLLAQNAKRQDILTKLAMLKDTNQVKNEALAAANTAKGASNQQAIDMENLKFKHQKELADLKGEKEKPATADERTSAMFATRAKDAAELANNIEQAGYNPASYGASFRTTSLPFVGMVGANSDDRSYNQAKRSFISAVLRKESGAAISDSEYENESKKYFPEPGDGPQQIAQKDAERKRAIQTLIAASGSAYNPANQQPFQYEPESIRTRGSTGAIAAPLPKNAKDIGAKPIEDMSDEEVQAELARLRGK